MYLHQFPPSVASPFRRAAVNGYKKQPSAGCLTLFVCHTRANITSVNHHSTSLIKPC